MLNCFFFTLLDNKREGMKQATKLSKLITTKMMQLHGLCLSHRHNPDIALFIIPPHTFQAVHASGWQPHLLSLSPPFICVTGVIRCLIIDNSSQVGNHLFHSLLVVHLTWLSFLRARFPEQRVS